MVAFSKAFILLLACFLLSLPSIGQQDSAALSEEYYRMGMEVFDYQHRKQASDMFILAAQINPKSAKAFFMAGQSIMLSLRKELSLPYYKKAYALDPKVDPDLLFHLGQAYHYSEKFDSAIYFYNRYSRLLARSMEYEKVKKMNDVNRKIFECYNAKVMVEYPVNVTIIHLDDKINSEFPDYAPAINAQESYIIFTTRRPEGNTNAKVATDHEYYEDIFFSSKVNGAWTPAKNLIGPLNTNFHNASVNLSPDGKEMLLYNDINGGDLFSSFLNADGSWTEPKSLDGINTPYIENSASISMDGTTIYFTSNRPGGYGGTDIYMCTKDSKGRWEHTQNLGALLNTDMDEDAVFISPNGKHLFFSSNGHAGMGDLDIYRSSYDEEKKQWGKPINMGYPVNSVENDIYFVLTGDEGIAYFSSVRDESLGEEDIYKLDISKWEPAAFTRPEFTETVLEQPLIPVLSSNGFNEMVTTLKFNLYVAESSSRQPITANVILAGLNNEVHVLKEISPGNYQTEIKKIIAQHNRYKLQISSNDYIPYSSSYHFIGSSLKEPVISDTVYLDKIAVNYNRILNVYFDINSDAPKTFDDIRYLEQIMNTSPTIKVEISGHTDNTGAADYNVSLSKRRSEAVKKYMVENGIDPARITVKGYGAEKPIADNNKREGRQLNRRTEFTIIEK
jgi:outer membrane protein OmpA-like peptidoglycan-associated protein/Tol biopolymer transport system component